MNEKIYRIDDKKERYGFRDVTNDSDTPTAYAHPSGCPSGLFLPLQWGLRLGQSGRPLLVPSTVVKRGAYLLEGSRVIGQHEASLGCGGLCCTGWPGRGGLYRCESLALYIYKINMCSNVPLFSF